MKTLNRLAALSAAGVLVLGTAACGTDDEVADAAAPTSSAPAGEMTPSAEATPVDGPFGPGCAAVPADGAGSFDGMSTAPVATAASNNPVLSTLVTAVTEAGLVDTLNGAQDITVFAPSNDAFAAVPEADLQALLADREALTRVLTYHVVGERIAPEDLGTAGPFETLAGPELAAGGSVPELTVGDSDASVVCGGIMTANANVYIIDQVLMPPAA